MDGDHGSGGVAANRVRLQLQPIGLRSESGVPVARQGTDIGTPVPHPSADDSIGAGLAGAAAGGSRVYGHRQDEIAGPDVLLEAGMGALGQPWGGEQPARDSVSPVGV